jgi:hypothetical protein
MANRISDMTADATFPEDAYIPAISASLSSTTNYKQLLTARIGTLVGATLGTGNLGTFTGSTIADNLSVKAAIQALETALEGTTTATRASLGLATSDSPQFAAINFGNASDTTVTRPSAGDISVEGNIIYRAGGTDVPVTDGGTGSSTAAGARTNLGLGTSAVVDTGTSGTKVALTDGANTWSGLNTYSAGANMTPASTPGTNAVGYLGIPQNIQNGTYAILMTDAGKHIYHTSGSAHTYTIPANASVAFPIGSTITFVNESGGGNVTIAITTDTLRWGSSTGSRTLAANGTATALKVASTTWRLTGDGIT